MGSGIARSRTDLRREDGSLGGLCIFIIRVRDEDDVGERLVCLAYLHNGERKHVRSRR
jgi:hypothetical protein